LSILQILAQIQEEATSYGMDADDVINRLVYGVGTNLIVSAGDPALGGVYKLVATEERWRMGAGHQNFRERGQDAQSRLQTSLARL
jgi:nicotinic acid phosphoribosyltransferase